MGNNKELENSEVPNNEVPDKPKRNLAEEKKLRGWKTSKYFFDNLPPEPKIAYKDFRILYDSMLNSLKDALLRGQIIFFDDIGKMYVKELKARKGVNPSTGEKIQLGVRKSVKFSINGKLKKALNTK
jgi:DNA-binding protein HU-beta